jgi:N-acetylglutamate synthase-like GNAT family acetyltransferase
VVGYMSIEEQVNADFDRARRRVFLRRVRARLRGDLVSDRLLCFEEVSKTLGALNRIRLGRKVVQVDEIAGSVGRCWEFDGGFMPTRASAGTRRKCIDRAFHQGEELPPVSLYKIGDSYFVLDGHHRVSVAHYQGVEMIDAEVTEFRTPLLVDLRQPGTVEEPKGHTRPDELLETEDSRVRETRNPRERIEVRWGLQVDEAWIAELLELNGMPRRVAAEEQFIVAVRDGRAVAALQYETATKKLVLGLLVADPWAGEPVLAKALYSKAHTLARELGVREVIAPSNRYGDYLYKTGYRRVIGGWSLDTARPLRAREEVTRREEGGVEMTMLRRVMALWGRTSIPLFKSQ